MRTRHFLASLAVAIAFPAVAQLGPAGVPGAPGLAPEPSKPAAAQPQQEKKPDTPAKIPAACAKAKNVEKCVARQELRQKARAACKGKAEDEYKQCFSEHMRRGKK